MNRKNTSANSISLDDLRSIITSSSLNKTKQSKLLGEIERFIHQRSALARTLVALAPDISASK